VLASTKRQKAASKNNFHNLRRVP